jgi:cytochrome P450
MAPFQRADLTSLALLVSALGTAWLLASTFAAWYRLRHIKGPFLASFSYVWMFRATTSGSHYDIYGDVFKKYGKLVRIGPNDLITGSLDVLQRMNAARSQYKRSSYYAAVKLDPYTVSIFSIADNAAHDKLKGQMVHGYGGKEVPTLEADIDEQIQKLVDVLRRRYASAKSYAPVDLAQMIHFLTLDVITKLAYGKALGHLEAEMDVIGYIKSSASQLYVIALCAEVPLLGRLLLNPLVFSFFGPKKTDSEGMGKLLSLSEELVSERSKAGAEDHLDMLGSFMRHGVTERQCQSEVPFQVIAGSDTTAHAIRATLLYLMTTPHAYRKLQGEIVEASARGSISKPVTYAEAKSLPYLQVTYPRFLPSGH